MASVTLDRCFCGQVVRTTRHRISTLRGLERILDAACGEGHGAHVSMSARAFSSLGGYETQYGAAVLRLPSGQRITVDIR